MEKSHIFHNFNYLLMLLWSDKCIFFHQKVFFTAKYYKCKRKYQPKIQLFHHLPPFLNLETLQTVSPPWHQFEKPTPSETADKYSKTEMKSPPPPFAENRDRGVWKGGKGRKDIYLGSWHGPIMPGVTKQTSRQLPQPYTPHFLHPPPLPPTNGLPRRPGFPLGTTTALISFRLWGSALDPPGDPDHLGGG